MTGFKRKDRTIKKVKCFAKKGKEKLHQFSLESWHFRFRKKSKKVEKVEKVVWMLIFASRL